MKRVGGEKQNDVGREREREEHVSVILAEFREVKMERKEERTE